MTVTAALLKAAKTILAEAGKGKAADAVKKATARKKNPAPRIGAKKPTRKSQITKQAPSKRLVKRRKANKVEGYFPNPAEVASAHKGSGKAHDVLPYAVLSSMNKPIAHFGAEKEAVTFAHDYAKRHKSTVKVVKM